MNPPTIVGHETAGDVVEVGRNVTSVKVGDRVSVETHVPCNDCFFCRNGMKEICKNVELFGVTINGAFAEYAKVRADAVFKLDDEITYEMACMFEPWVPVSTAWRRPGGWKDGADQRLRPHWPDGHHSRKGVWRREGYRL